MKEADVYIQAGVPIRRKKNGEVDGRHFQPRRGGKHAYEYRRLFGQRAHRLLVELRTGIKLPATAIVHHVDPDDKRENRGLFVVCPDSAYHHLIEYRGRALRECGHANWRKCQRCGKWDRPENLVITERPRRIGLQYHTAHPERGRKCVDADWPRSIGDGLCEASPSRRHNVGTHFDFKKRRTKHGLESRCVECGAVVRRMHERATRWYAVASVSPLSERGRSVEEKA